MRKIGLVGGLGPASTVEYYLGLTELFLNKHGVYPEIVIDSVNMFDHTQALSSGDYEQVCVLLIKSLQNLKAAGASVAAITANTEHIVWDMAKSRFPLPVVSITDAVTKEITLRNFRCVVVLATEFTLRSGLYKHALEKAGITAIIPDNEDIELLGKLIYPNLENGIVIPKDKKKMIALAEKYIRSHSADALLLGCTEIPLAVKPKDVCVPVIDSAAVHINAVYRAALKINDSPHLD